YNGVNMSFVEGSSHSAGSYITKTELYYLLDSNLPPPGSYMVEVSYIGDVDKRCGGAISLANIAQQAAEAVATNSNIGPNSISTDITTQTYGALVIDIAGCGNEGFFSTIDTNMVERFDISSNSSSEACGTKFATSVGPTTMSWNHSGANQLVHSVAVFAPAPLIISGRIIEPNDSPISGVVVSADPNGAPSATDPNGHYMVFVPYGWSGLVTATKDEHVFNPSERTYSNVITNKAGQDYKDISAYDLNSDGSIGLSDLAVVSDHWLENGPNVPGDLHRDVDNTVNLLDLAELGLAW
ncbi:MAG: hypothetical protein ACYS8Y_03250, partial [Planctomycetota bacterium]